jgi:hypothetical protein
MPETYRALLGVYLSTDEGLLWRLEWRDGTLTYLDPRIDLAQDLSPTDDRTCSSSTRGARVGEPVRFRRTGDGRVRSVLLASETHVRLDPVGDA